MKVVPPKSNTVSTKAALLPLMEDTEQYKLDKANSVSYELRTQPGDNNSPTCKYLIWVLEATESIRQVLKWRKDVDKVSIGLNVNDFEAKKPLVETLMRTGPLALFHKSIQVSATAAKSAAIAAAADAAAANAERARPITDFHAAAHIRTALNFVVQQLLPRRVLAKVKRALRREMRKPADMKVRAYYQQITRINTEEVASLPPFALDQALGDDEMIDILLYGSPKSWQKEMDRQGFDPLEHPIQEVVDFMENIESSEDFDGSKVDSSKKKLSKATNKNSKNGDRYCMLHGKGNHSTEDCIQLKEQAKRLKSERSSNQSGGKTFHKNKTWQKDAAKASAKAKSDLAALIKKTVRKEVAVVQKKRKPSDDDSIDLNALEELKDFNYDQFKGMSIEDDNSVNDEASC